MVKKSKKRYTKEFKQDAVNLVEKQGYTNTEAARSLGVSEAAEKTIWLKQASKDLRKDAEIKRLMKENERLRMEREILKKAAAFFARETL